MVKSSSLKRRLLATHLFMWSFIGLISFPLIMVLSISFRAGNFAVGELIPSQPSLEHWALALGFTWTTPDGVELQPSLPVMTWFFNSIKVSLLSSVLIVALSTTGAYGFARLNFRFKLPLLKTLFVIQMFPPALALTAYYTFFDRLGDHVSWLGINSHWSLILAYSGGIVMHIWLIRGYFQTIDVALEEAAVIDGATPWQTFRLVMLPLSLPVLAVVFILSFVGTISEFPLASVLLQDFSEMTLAVGARQFLFPQRYMWGDFAAVAILTGLPITLVFLWCQRWIVDGLTAGGVKG